MKSLASSLRGGSDSGTPLPDVIPQLAQLGAHIRLGELSLFASAPGVGKSILALHIAIRIGLPTLYISADTSEHTQVARAASMLTGDYQPFVLQMLKEEPSFYDKVLGEYAGHIQFEYGTSPDIRDIRDQVASFAVLNGDYPHLLVVDNLRNVYSEEADAQAHQHNCEDLKKIAAETGSAVLVLSHTIGSVENGHITPTQGDLENKIAKSPALIVSLSHGKMGDLRLAVLKNRYGPANAAGRLKCFVPVDLSRMKVN